MGVGRRESLKYIVRYIIWIYMYIPYGYTCIYHTHIHVYIVSVSLARAHIVRYIIWRRVAASAGEYMEV